MNAQSKIQAENVYRKLSKARQMFHATELRKTGKNTFAGYSYFELGDFLVPALRIFEEVGLCAIISFDSETATMRIVNADDPADFTTITSPMGSAALKGCHEVQNIGAVETYQRRYLWVSALEIVEHDALDATNGKGEPEAKVRLIDDAQWSELVQLIEVTNSDTQAFCKAYKIGSLKELPADAFARAQRQLNTKLEKMKEPA